MTTLRPQIALVVLALAGTTLTACAPAPEDLCGHVVDLVKQKLGDKVDAMPEDEVQSIKKNCIKEAKKEREKNGAMAYKKQAQCVMAATDLDELEECESAEQAE